MTGLVTRGGGGKDGTVMRGLRLGTKLPLMLVSVSFVALAVMGIASYHLSATTLKTNGIDRLEQTLGSRVEMLQHWSAQQEAGIRAAGISAGISRAVRDLADGWDALGPDAGQEMRRIYVEENPYPAGERHKLTNPEALNAYTLQHRRYAASFLAMIEQNELADVFLVGVTGNVLYSFQKDANFGTNLFDSAPVDAELIRVAREAIGAKTSTGPFVSQFTQDYSGGRGQRVVYLATPLKSDAGLTLGALVFEAPLNMLSAIMTEARALGQTGQGYLVDSDRKLLTPLREVPRPTTGTFDVPEDVVQRALKGEVGHLAALGIDGMSAVSAFAPIDIFGRRFAAIVEQTTAEIYQPAMMLARNMLLCGVAVLILLAVMSWLMARSVSWPLARLTQTVRAISGGNYDTAVGEIDRRDEVGDIARALGNLRDDLSQASTMQLEATIQGTAFRTSSAAMMMVNSDFVISYVNEAMVKLIDTWLEDFRKLNPEMEPTEMVGKPMDLFHSTPTRQREILSNSENLPYHVDIPIGNGRFALDINEISLPEVGQIGFVVEWRDVTEIRMNRAVLAAIGRTQLIMELSSDGLVTRVNDALADALGTPAPEMLGLAGADIIARDEIGCNELWHQMESHESVVGRFSLTAPSGRIVIAEGSMTVVPDRRNQILKIVLIANDVTEAQTALRLEKERADTILADQRQVVESLRIGLNALSTGDLTTRIDDDFPREYEKLRRDFNAAVGNLADAIQVVIDNAAAIDGEAREISSAAEDLSDRTEKQAATLEQTAAALDELTVSVSSATTGVMDANRVVKLARESAESSGRIVQEAVAAMGEIEHSSRKISRIISVIDDIAFQTNLLALNAGVEAARAGEAGRGFAVVASEVRALAQRSSEAAREIDGLITASSNQVRCGVDLVGETGTALEKILESVNDIASRVAEIAASSHEQASGLSEINIAVNQLDQVTQHNAAMFEETTAASHALTRGAQALATAAAKFKTARAPQISSGRNDVTPRSASAEKGTYTTRSRSMPGGEVTFGNTMRLVHREEEDWEEF